MIFKQLRLIMGCGCLVTCIRTFKYIFWFSEKSYITMKNLIDSRKNLTMLRTGKVDISVLIEYCMKGSGNSFHHCQRISSNVCYCHVLFRQFCEVDRAWNHFDAVVYQDCNRRRIIVLFQVLLVSKLEAIWDSDVDPASVSPVNPSDLAVEESASPQMKPASAVVSSDVNSQKTNSNFEIPWLVTMIPLYATLIALISTTLGARGGNRC